MQQLGTCRGYLLFVVYGRRYIYTFLEIIFLVFFTFLIQSLLCHFVCSPLHTHAYAQPFAPRHDWAGDPQGSATTAARGHSIRRWRDLPKREGLDRRESTGKWLVTCLRKRRFGGGSATRCIILSKTGYPGGKAGGGGGEGGGTHASFMRLAFQIYVRLKHRQEKLEVTIFCSMVDGSEHYLCSTGRGVLHGVYFSRWVIGNVCPSGPGGRTVVQAGGLSVVWVLVLSWWLEELGLFGVFM